MSSSPQTLCHPHTPYDFDSLKSVITLLTNMPFFGFSDEAILELKEVEFDTPS